MCGRFNVIDNPELQQLLKELGIDLGLPERSNIAPTESIALVRGGPQQRELAQLRWWLTPRWAAKVDQKYAMFNARSETLGSSRAFAQPFRQRRGIVPASSFIEWRAEDGGRQPYCISARGRALALAAIWEVWERDGQRVESCALVTTAAAPEFEHIHQRMPVMLAPAECERWLDCSAPVAAQDPLFAPVLKQVLEVVPLSRAVNNARNKEPALLEATAEVQTLRTAS
jgi:putative SOS response-associated peptidase YedK